MQLERHCELASRHSSWRAVSRENDGDRSERKLERNRARRARIILGEPVAATIKTSRLYSGRTHRRARIGTQTHPGWVSVGVRNAHRLENDSRRCSEVWKLTAVRFDAEGIEKVDAGGADACGVVGQA